MRRGVYLKSDGGFTLLELAIVMFAAFTITAVSAPSISTFLKMQRAASGARLVERQLQTARLQAVSASRALRVKFNCPSTGKMRILELTGVATTDNASNRCDPTYYPSPGPADTLRSTPSLDSPVIDLPSGTTVSGSTLFFEFSPRGSVFSVSGSTVTLLGTDATLTVTRQGFSKTITVSGLGRIRVN